MPAGVHNGALLKGARRDRVIEAIAQGESDFSIAKRMHISPQSLRAVRLSEWCKVESRKAVLAAQAENIAAAAAERLQGELLSRRHIPASALVPIWGVAIDKVAALRSDPAANVSNHLHVHLQSNDIARQFNELLNAMTKPADDAAVASPKPKTVKARVVEPDIPSK